MEIIESLQQLERIEKGWVLTIGNFDGVHLGHQQIIRRAQEAAERTGARGVCVMTFDPHPVAILRPGKAPGVLTPMTMRAHLLEKYGVDCLVVMRDSVGLLNLAPRDFVDDFLMKYIEPKVIVEGPNFSFGYGRSGDVKTLEEFSAERGFEVIEVSSQRLQSWGDKPVMYSSTLIRNSLDRGDVVTASSAMGRFYRLVGATVAGRGIGRTLGYPTANIDANEQVVPAEGVYAGFVKISDSYKDACTGSASLCAAFSLGRAKTFVKDHPLLIEAHILDEKIGDLSGKWLSMDFVKLIRNQRRFDDKEQLKFQIGVDCRMAREMLKKAKRDGVE